MNQSNKIFLGVCLIFVSFMSFSQLPEPIELPPELDRVLRDYEKNWIAYDATGLASLFTDDGFILRPGKEPVRGKVAIAKAYTGAGGNLVLGAYEYETSGTVGYIIGYYKGAENNPPAGKFILTLKKINNKWLISADMDNPNNIY